MIIDAQLCTSCGLERPLSAFGTTPSGEPLRRCRDCLNTKYRESAARRAAHEVMTGTKTLPERIYSETFSRQRGLCIVCLQQEKILGPDGLPKKLSFYGHSGGARGLICTLCDVALKALRDDPGIAGRMVAFLAGGLATIFEARVHREDEPDESKDVTVVP